VWLPALAIGAFQVIGSFGAAHGQPDRKPIDAVAVLLVLVGPAGLTLRDRWPLVSIVLAVAAADVYIGLGYPFGPVFVSIAFALFTAIRQGRRRGAVVIAAVGFASYVLAVRLDTERVKTPGLVHLSLVAGWLVVVLAVSEVVHVRWEQRIERRRAHAEEQRRRVGEQRMLLAQELHDVLAHHISLINVQASVALHLLDEQPDRARPALTHIKEASRDALHELRTALDLLRGEDADAPRAPAPRLADLPALVAGVRAGGLDVRLDEGERPTSMLPAVELATYRIVQEALTNVTRHARARRVDVRIRYDDGVRIDVVDDGVGTQVAGSSAGSGNGIRGMCERAVSLGGTLVAGPRPGGGFHVTAHLPRKSE